MSFPQMNINMAAAVESSSTQSYKSRIMYLGILRGHQSNFLKARSGIKEKNFQLSLCIFCHFATYVLCSCTEIRKELTNEMFAIDSVTVNIRLLVLATLLQLLQKCRLASSRLAYKDPIEPLSNSQTSCQPSSDLFQNIKFNQFSTASVVSIFFAAKENNTVK